MSLQWKKVKYTRHTDKIDATSTNRVREAMDTGECSDWFCGCGRRMQIVT